MQNTIFFVNEEPYCIWEHNIVKTNLNFINGIDTEYFEYLRNTYLASEDEKRVVVSLRTTFHHALETMFSFIGAYIQAPTSTYAWIPKCSNNDLRQIVKKINKRDNNLFTMNVEGISWESIAKSIFQTYKPDSKENEQIIKSFTKLWEKLSLEYLDENYIDEYNSIKHGFRIQSGGFALSVGTEHQFGVSPAENKMKMVGSSKYGSAFYKIKKATSQKANRSLVSSEISVSWDMEKTTLLIQFISMSIQNIVSAIKIANGENPENCKFSYPKENKDFEKPWLLISSIQNMKIQIGNKDKIKFITKQDIIDIVNQHKEHNKN